MMSGKATRKFVPPKCSRGEFERHTKRQAAFAHSHRIYTCETARHSEASRARESEPPTTIPPITHLRQRKPAPSHLVPLFGDEVPDTFSLGVPHPLTNFIHRPSARLVWVLMRPTSFTAVKAHVPARWGVRSRHRQAAQDGHISESHCSTYL